MAILTALEAREILGFDEGQEMPVIVLSIIVPAINDFLKSATGKDWGAQAPIDPTAKMAASILLVRWFDNPGQIGAANASRYSYNIDSGMSSLIGQLEAKALKEKQAGGG